MAKTIIAIMLILLTGGAWVYLDYLNRLEKAEAEEMRRDIEKAHARAIAKGRFESESFADLANCREAAKQANHDFVARHEQPVPGKPGQVTAPSREVMDEAVKKLEAAYVLCQQTYDTRLRSGTASPQPVNAK